jgi:class 3 adenylate cyclase/predicted ATPase
VFCTGCGLRRDTDRLPAEATPTQEERRRVSVLFIDLVDFTPYVERADPELVRSMQQAFFSAARRVIGQYGGVVEKYIGDAVMALFGAPVATETDALRCVRAGLELQRVLARFAPTGSDGMQFRAGVATGEAIVDLATARDGGQAIVAGDVVNTASRIQSAAPPGGVLVCAPTHALTSSAIRYEPQPPAVLRGRSAPTEVWLALAPIQRQPAGPEPDTTPLVDREHELGLLINALHRTLRDRTPQLVTVFGRAGIGKSRLVRELFRHAERLIDEPVTWRIGHCPPFGENVTVAALADIVKAETGILDTDTAVTAEARLTETVRDLVGPEGRAGALREDEVDRLVGALRPLVGLPVLPARLTGAAAEADSAWRRFLVAGAVRRPTVLVFEDVHWADERMRRFVELLGASARDVPLLVLCTARPELIDRDPSWAGTIGGSLTITLPPLRSSGIATLFSHLFSTAAFTADLLSPLIELADGNPLYAQEYVRMLIERGAVRQGGRGWTLDGAGGAGKPGQDLPMPDSVHAVIANRIDLLDAADRTVLLAASVVGTNFWPGAVAAALGRPVEVVERSLRRLEQREFVYEQAGSTMAGQSELRFRHVLVRDVCYRRLPRTERMARHERTADWLDALSQSRDTDLAEVLAHHRWSAYEVSRDLGVDAAPRAPAAVEALHRAARRAYALHSLDAAAAHVGRALALLSADPAAASESQRLDLELFGTEISFYRDQHEFLVAGGPKQLTALAEQLQARGNAGSAARAWTLLGQAAWMRTDRDAALSHVERAVALFEPLPDSPEKADAYAELGRLRMLDYERDPAIAAAEAAAQIAERLGLAEVLANARITAGIARYQAGDRTGLDELEEAYEFCRTYQLLAGRRAAQNLAYAVMEEGYPVRSSTLLADSQGQVQVGQNLTPSFSDEVQDAYFAGEFDRLLAAADAYAGSEAGSWDLQVRGMRGCFRLLRGEPLPGPPHADDIAEVLRIARGTGFHRPLWVALGAGALCRSLQGRGREAVGLLAELVAARSQVPALVSSHWSAAVATAAALCGREAALMVKGMLEEGGNLTPWGSAALDTVDAVVADADGEHDRAADLFIEAAQRYARMPNTTERMLCLALAAGALTRAGQTGRAEPLLAEVRAFALRNRAPGLLQLTHPGRPDVSWSPDLAS